MNVVPRKEGPEDLLKDSVLARIAATHFSAGKRRANEKPGVAPVAASPTVRYAEPAATFPNRSLADRNISSLPHVSRPAVQAFIAVWRTPVWLACPTLRDHAERFACSNSRLLS